MGRHYALTVHLHDARYHGAEEWPPAPARVFQALVAGAARGRRVPEDAARALELLQGLAPPVIAAPVARRGQLVGLFVPNNDLDAVGGDPERVGDVRVKKTVQPYLLEGEPTLLYAWPLPQGGGEELVALAGGLYQLGRGVDAAWAVGELIDDQQLAARLRAHRGGVHRPRAGDGARVLAVPTSSSLPSLVRRFEATLVRLRSGVQGRTLFVQPPKAHFSFVHYDGTARYRLLELRRESEPARSAPWPAHGATALVEHVRDTAFDALSSALPARRAEIERVLIGRRQDGTNEGPSAERVRFIPLPSIGHEHADQSIRRVLVCVPPGPLSEDDVLWALTGRSIKSVAGEARATTLAAGPADEMVERYRAAARRWRSITPLALGSAMRRRIEPKRRRHEAKSATERQTEERAARNAVAQALRHAGVQASLVGVRVQREPFDGHGTRAERFAQGTRFAKESLWHAEITLDRELRGPLVLGDGRFLGLGVMAPQSEHGAFALHVEGGLAADVDTTALARALRRAVMARVASVLGGGRAPELPAYFHGHTRGGEPLRADHSTHLAFSVDVVASRLLIVPPHVLDGRRRPARDEAALLGTLERALEGFTTLRAGKVGVLSLRVARLPPGDELCRSACVFRSVSDYVVSRHSKLTSAERAVIVDVHRECERRRLPRPAGVQVTWVRGVAGVGVVARVELTFLSAIPGPLLLGKTRYLGGGLFRPV